MTQAPDQAALEPKRAAFEQHYQRTRGVNLAPERADDGYRSERAHEAWVDWQAGAASVAPVPAVGDQAIIDCFTKAGVWLGVQPEEVARNVQAVRLALEAFGAVAPAAHPEFPRLWAALRLADSTIVAVSPWETLRLTYQSAEFRVVEVAPVGLLRSEVRKSEDAHRADFEMALKGNNLKRWHQVSHAAYMDAMIENMWRGWLRKARFDGATLY